MRERDATEDAASAQVVAEAIEQELVARGTPERAAKERAYLKSTMVHHGATLPNIHDVVKVQLRARPPLDHDAAVALARALWARASFDCRMAAVDVLGRAVKRLGPADLDLIESMVRESGTWALVDGLAGSVASTIVATAGDDQRVVTRLDRWVADDDLWVRRAALLAHLRVLRAGEDDVAIGRFLDYADRLVDEREFFIRKAIGWGLRDLGRHRPDLVEAWLAGHVDRCSTVTLREAVKPLSPDQRVGLGLDERGRRPR